MRYSAPRSLSVLLAVLSLSACDQRETTDQRESTERWIGYYQLPGNDIRLPIFMELSIKGESVTGRSADSSDVATISGTLVENHYKLLLHPLDRGTATDQDIHFLGRRSENRIVGEWVHVVGVSGNWQAEITELDEQDAMDLYRIPCDKVVVAKEDGRSVCPNGA